MTNDPTPTVEGLNELRSRAVSWRRNHGGTPEHKQCDPIMRDLLSALAALREQNQELREDVERHKEDHGAACLLAWRIYAAAMSESVDTFQGVPGPDVVLAVEARIDNLCNDETRDPMWFKRAEKAEADLDAFRQAARRLFEPEGTWEHYCPDRVGFCHAVSESRLEALRLLVEEEP